MAYRRCLPRILEVGLMSLFDDARPQSVRATAETVEAYLLLLLLSFGISRGVTVRNLMGAIKVG